MFTLETLETPFVFRTSTQLVLSPPPWPSQTLLTPLGALYLPLTMTATLAETQLETLLRERCVAIARNRGYRILDQRRTQVDVRDPREQPGLLWCSVRSLKANSFAVQVPRDINCVAVVARWPRRRALEARYPHLRVWIMDLSQWQDSFIASEDGGYWVKSEPRSP